MAFVTAAIDLLARALAQTGSLIAAVREDQREWPTPCPRWSVHDLVQHVAVQDLRNFQAAARGEVVDWQAPAGDLGRDWSGAFGHGARRLLEVWRSADLDRPVAMPGGAQATLGGRLDVQIAEFAVHAWDLARAIGDGRDLDPAIAEHALSWAKGMLRPEFRGPDKAFGVEVEVDPSAPIYDRLAGWFGRNSAWRSNRL